VVREATARHVPEAFARFAFSNGIESWLRAVFACNQYVDTQAPWALRKTDPERMGAVLGTMVVAVRELAQAIAPVIPASAEKLLAAIAAGEGGAPIAQPVPLFPRLDLPSDEEAAA
jgi:methionyl-tRNA synthetase